MCIRDRDPTVIGGLTTGVYQLQVRLQELDEFPGSQVTYAAVSYTHLRAHETVLDLVCRLLLEKKKKKQDTEGLPLEYTLHLCSMHEGSNLRD